MTGGAGRRRHAPARSGATPPSRLRDSTGRLPVVDATRTRGKPTCLSMKRMRTARVFRHLDGCWRDWSAILTLAPGPLFFMIFIRKAQRGASRRVWNIPCSFFSAAKCFDLLFWHPHPEPQAICSSSVVPIGGYPIGKWIGDLEIGHMLAVERIDDQLPDAAFLQRGEGWSGGGGEGAAALVDDGGHGWASQACGGSASGGRGASLSSGAACSVSSRASSVAVSGKATWSSGQAARGMLLRCFHDRTVTGCAPIARAKASEPPRRSMSWAADRMATHCMTQRCQASAPLRRVMLHGVTPSL